jgi:hypothetical protein
MEPDLKAEVAAAWGGHILQDQVEIVYAPNAVTQYHINRDSHAIKNHVRVVEHK